ncbi:hypothetical protein, partial [Tenacibaculum piscium]|uniref:hypothetical protein n=1 Tax=Tenacibaculum piscium TaxID=1458515 RepID=UPI0018E934D7
MIEFIIGGIVLLAIFFFVNKVNNKKCKVKEENKRLEFKKLEAEQKENEKIRLQKIEDEKHENFTVIISGLGQNTSKFKCILKRKNNTFAYIERTNTSFKLERINTSSTFEKTNTGYKFDRIDTLKLLKEEANNFKWINEEEHKIKQKNIEDEKYENFTVILSGLEQNTSKFKCILKRKNNTFA